MIVAEPLAHLCLLSLQAIHHQCYCKLRTRDRLSWTLLATMLRLVQNPELVNMRCYSINFRMHDW